MKKLTDIQRTYLFLIDSIGGSYCPDADSDPGAVKILNDLAKAKRLRVEPTDALPRYHLTAQGRADAGA